MPRTKNPGHDYLHAQGAPYPHAAAPLLDPARVLSALIGVAGSVRPGPRGARTSGAYRGSEASNKHTAELTSTAISIAISIR